MSTLDLGDLGLDAGGLVLLKRALRGRTAGETLAVRGRHPELAVHLPAWCRRQGLEFERDAGPGDSAGGFSGRVRAAMGTSFERAGAVDPARPGAVVESPPAHWGLAARGATVDPATPPFHFPWHERVEIWADEAPALYAQAAAAQWDPATAIDWSAAFELPEEVEDAVVQVMTYLIENETVALIVPSRFLAQIHPHFREVLQVLAIQAADEARHIEVFTRRAALRRSALGSSSAGGQASLKTLLEEPDFALASFLLSVLGEGSFLTLLWFLHEHAPDPITRRITQLAAQDEARHVAFGLAHLRRHLGADPGLRPRLRGAAERRHDVLRQTAGLNEEVFDALVVLAAGNWNTEAIAAGHRRVMRLQEEMDRARRGRLAKLGFDDEEAAAISGLHTRNFM